MPANRKTKIEAANPSVRAGDDTDCTAIKARVDSIDWAKIRAGLDTQGWAVAPEILTYAEADSISGPYPHEQGFRSHIVMARHGFGRGEYKYFSYPLPPLARTFKAPA